jgi:hypothetical protein
MIRDVADQPAQVAVTCGGHPPPETEISTLVAALPDGIVVTDPDILRSYRQEGRGIRRPAFPRRSCAAPAPATWYRRCAGRARTGAGGVAGCGCGLSGGAGARSDGIVVSTERVRQITVDVGTRNAIVQPGLLNAEVKAAVAAVGLWYPLDPSSFEICSIGGNCRHQCRRVALREIRGDRRLRARSGGSARRRYRGDWGVRGSRTSPGCR